MRTPISDEVYAHLAKEMRNAARKFRVHAEGLSNPLGRQIMLEHADKLDAQCDELLGEDG